MLTRLIEDLTALLEQIVLTFGVPGIALIAFMENIFPPTPSEFLYPMAGKIAYDGKIDLLAVIISGGIGSLVGAVIFYHVGYYMGEARVRTAISRYGTLKIGQFRLRFFTLEAYDQAASAFRQHGGIIVMVARSMPLIHGVISIPAGVVRMNRLKFMTYTFIGVLLWVTPTVLLGYALGSQWERALSFIDAYETIWYIVIVAGVSFYLVRRWRRESPLT